MRMSYDQLFAMRRGEFLLNMLFMSRQFLFAWLQSEL